MIRFKRVNKESCAAMLWYLNFRWVALAVSISSLGASLLLWGTGDVVGKTLPPGYCQGSVFKDYLAPLDRLPSDEGFPESGRLRVGSPILRIYPPRERLVVVGQDSFESFGSLFHKIGGPSPPLRWWMTSSLERISQSGSPLKTVRSARQYIGTVKAFGGRIFGFDGKVSPGLYRLSVRIESKAGRFLTNYSEYFRAVEARSNLELAAEPPIIPAGGIGSLRVKNHGTVIGTYFSEYRIWGVGGKELSLPPQIFGDNLPFLHPGNASPCIRLQIPSDAPPGAYWVGMEAKPSLNATREYLATQLTISSP